MLLQATYAAIKQGNLYEGYLERMSCTAKSKIVEQLLIFVIAALGVWSFSAIGVAQTVPPLPRTRVCQILDRREDLGLSESQARRLKSVVQLGQRKMLEARAQAEIRLQEISKVSTDWSDINGLAIKSLIKEYYGFLSDYITADLECITNASKVLDRDQLASLGKYLSPDSLQLDPSIEIARITTELRITKKETKVPEN
ncbi:MAG: hypothetical protein A2W25_08145 [candidate division Zixibacteria bacterium RBG_16_53_22]|nr:MAG: hypothetical protein A2W25_08145 [candidate division Zixibacteria bacterium RBG_16_53_22]